MASLLAHKHKDYKQNTSLKFQNAWDSEYTKKLHPPSHHSFTPSKLVLQFQSFLQPYHKFPGLLTFLPVPKTTPGQPLLIGESQVGLLECLATWPQPRAWMAGQSTVSLVGGRVHLLKWIYITCTSFFLSVCVSVCVVWASSFSLGQRSTWTSQIIEFIVCGQIIEFIVCGGVKNQMKMVQGELQDHPVHPHLLCRQHWLVAVPTT